MMMETTLIKIGQKLHNEIGYNTRDLGKLLSKSRRIWYSASCNIFNKSAPDFAIIIIAVVWIECTSVVHFSHKIMT